MSHTTVCGFPREGEGFVIGEVHNAFRGAMAVWDIIAKEHFGLERFPMAPRSTKMEQRIWNTWQDRTLPLYQRVVLASTLDTTLVRYDHIPTLIEHMFDFDANFSGQTNLAEQALLIEESALDENLFAVGWNQTSVCSNPWEIAGYDEDKYHMVDLSVDLENNTINAGWLCIPPDDDRINIVEAKYILDSRWDTKGEFIE